MLFQYWPEGHLEAQVSPQTCQLPQVCNKLKFSHTSVIFFLHFDENIFFKSVSVEASVQSEANIVTLLVNKPMFIHPPSLLSLTWSGGQLLILTHFSPPPVLSCCTDCFNRLIGQTSQPWSESLPHSALNLHLFLFKLYCSSLSCDLYIYFFAVYQSKKKQKQNRNLTQEPCVRMFWN